MYWLADPSGTVDLSVFAQYGVLGIVASLLVWYAKGSVRRERDRADRMEAEVQRLNALISDRAIPALTAASVAAEKSASLLQDIQRERTMLHLLERQQRQGRDEPSGEV